MSALDSVASHLRDPEQRQDVATLGMWIFLSTEVLFFGALFLGFAVYRISYPEAFIAASARLDVALGSLNTLVLLTSSFFAALAVMAARSGDRRRSTRHLVITVALAVVFLCIKGYEWYTEYTESLVPGIRFDLPGVNDQLAAGQELFFCFYFIMTGVHAIHMLAGTGVMGWLILRGYRGNGNLTQTEQVRIESTALYWHFVDIVWVFLLPVLYLTGLD